MMVISATAGFAMVLIVCMAYWPSQEFLSGFACYSIDLLFQEMMVYGGLSHTFFGPLPA
jgi:hypothetical protein